MTTRTRFAPSPTGYLHVGGVRTALFAWLLARANGGQFILRIEDTDKAREVKGAEQHIQDSLAWVGVDWDEGPDVGGPFGPYRQSERLAIYREWAEKLAAASKAYADPYTPEQVQAFREQAKQHKQPFLFRNYRPAEPPAWNGHQPLRLKSEPKSYNWQDAVMGSLSSGPEVIDDFILMKSDGYPTYNFCHIVDDALMQISHVIRSQEFIASVPRYLNLYEALEITPPILATLPFVLGADGRKKLGKRDGAKDILDYARDGYLPAAMLNFLATLGWNDGSEQEIFSPGELVEKFSLSRVARAGARFDPERLLWMNGCYLRQLSIDELYPKTAGFWPPEAEAFNDEYKKQVLGLIQERLKFLAEIPSLSHFFFTDLPVNSELISGHKQLGKLPAAELKNLLEQSREVLEASDFTFADLTERLNKLLKQTNQKPVVLFSLIRVSTTQAPASPGLSQTLAVLGKVRSLERINRQLADLS